MPSGAYVYSWRRKEQKKKTGRKKEDCTKTSETNEAEGEEERGKVQSRGKRKGQRKHLLPKTMTHALRTRAESRAAIEAKGIFAPSTDGIFEGAKTQV